MTPDQRNALSELTAAAQRRASELRAGAEHADDRGAATIEREAAEWERLARFGREALSG
jgi:hypothetical protein